jgi:hypothetical protein
MLSNNMKKRFPAQVLGLVEVRFGFIDKKFSVRDGFRDASSPDKIGPW